MGDHNQSCLFVLDQFSNVVDTETNAMWTLGYSLRLSFLALLCTLFQAFFLGLGRLWTILVKQAEDLSS